MPFISLFSFSDVTAQWKMGSSLKINKEKIIAFCSAWTMSLQLVVVISIYLNQTTGLNKHINLWCWYQKTKEIKTYTLSSLE